MTPARRPGGAAPAAGLDPIYPVGMGVIGLDLDGPCADYLGAMRAVAAQIGGVDPSTLPTPITWGLEQWFGDRNKYLKAHHEAVHDLRIFRDLEATPGASETITALHSEGHLIRVISHRLKGGDMDPAVVLPDTVRWLSDNGIPFDDIAFVDDKSDVRADVYIDDDPAVVASLRDMGRQVIVYDLPYNRHVYVPKAARACGWGEAETALRTGLRRSERLRPAV